jgi:hypothetical protein
VRRRNDPTSRTPERPSRQEVGDATDAFAEVVVTESE